MKILLVGGGKVGSAVASQLVSEGHDITVVDTNKNVIDSLSAQLDIMTLCGSGSSPDILREAGIGDSDLLIACTEQDEVNALCCVFAKQLGCRSAIARVRTPDYAKQIYMFKEQFGLSMTVNPELYAAKEIYNLLEMPGAIKRESFARKRVEIVEIPTKKGSVLDGLKLADLQSVTKQQTLICAVRRGSEVYIPNGNFVIQAGDKINVCAESTHIVKILRSLGLRYEKCDNVMILGAGMIADYLTGMLLPDGVHVKVIESDAAKAEIFAAKYPKAAVIHADGTDEEILEAENIKNMDAVISLTGRDEQNLILSMYANKCGVRQVLAQVGHTNFGSMFANSDKLKLISPKNLCADAITGYVRAMQNSEGDNILALHHIIEKRVAAIEFEIKWNFKHAGKPLMELKTKQNCLIACINRKGKIIIPGGRDTLEPGDTAIVVSETDHIILDLDDIFI